MHPTFPRPFQPLVPGRRNQRRTEKWERPWLMSASQWWRCSGLSLSMSWKLMMLRTWGVYLKKLFAFTTDPKDRHNLVIEIVVNSRRRMHLCMQDDQNGQKTMVLTSAEETRLTCFILLQNIFFWSNQPSLTADVNTIINLPWYPRKIVHFSLVLSPSRVYYDFYGPSLIFASSANFYLNKTPGTWPE